MFERLRAGPLSVGALAKHMPVSRPAVSQHLKVLKEAGLVTDHAEGTRRVYAIDPDGLRSIVANPVLIDGRCTLDANAWRAAGWTVLIPGRPS